MFRIRFWPMTARPITPMSASVSVMPRRYRRSLRMDRWLSGREDAGVKPLRSWLRDMEGVLAREEPATRGGGAFARRLRELGLPFLVLTNTSISPRRDLSAR